MLLNGKILDGLNQLGAKRGYLCDDKTNVTRQLGAPFSST